MRIWCFAQRQSGTCRAEDQTFDPLNKRQPSYYIIMH